MKTIKLTPEAFNIRSVESPVSALHLIRGAASEHGRVTPLRQAFEVQVFAVPQVGQGRVGHLGVRHRGKGRCQAF